MTAFQFPESRLLLFAREPVAGQVKTRLQPELEALGCLELHRALLRRAADTLSSACLAPWQLWVDGNPAHPDFLALRNEQAIFQQQGTDLGERMFGAVAQALGEPGVEAVVLVGADCPSVDGDYLEQALTALAGGAEAVVGPAEDGGYVLLGLRRARAEVFANVQWGESSVLATTLTHLAASGIEPMVLETRWDVDRPADLPRLSGLKPPLALGADLQSRIAALTSN